MEPTCVCEGVCVCVCVFVRARGRDAIGSLQPELRAEELQVQKAGSTTTKTSMLHAPPA